MVKPQANLKSARDWVTNDFPDNQIWQVRNAHYYDDAVRSDGSRVVLELAPAVGTYRIFRMAEGEHVPALIAPPAAKGRGYNATLPLTAFPENGYGPRAAWERLVERVALAPLPEKTRQQMLEEKLVLRAWTEPHVWAEGGPQPARVELIVECPKDAQLAVSGIPGVKLEWQRDSELLRRAAMRLPEGEHRILVQAKLGERQARAAMLLTVTSRESWYRQVLDRNLNWFRASGMLPAPDGSQGVREGFRSSDQALNGSLRTDCVTQSGLCFYLYGQLTGDPAWKLRGENALNYLFKIGFQDQNRAHATFGFWNFYDTLYDFPQEIYVDDNGWAAYVMLRMYQLTGKRDYLARGLATVDGFLETQTPGGLRLPFMGGPTLLKNGRQWYVSMGDKVALLAYSLTKDKKYLDSARRAIDVMANDFPNFTTNTSLTRATQFARFISSPALMYHYIGEQRYLDLLRKVVRGLKEHQDATGAIREWASPGRENFGGEGAVITEDDEPISDQLYTTNFALLNLQEACQLLGEKESCDTFVRLADYLSRIQLRSQDPHLDGAWNRVFDFKNWEMYGNNSDPAWGPYSIESGWTNTIISIALMDYLERRSAFLPPRP